jgi:hypothetical protein
MLNRNSFRVLFTVGAVVLGACNVQGALDDLKDQAIDKAFKAVSDNAKAHGGNAILVRPGKEYILTVNDPASKINGATIKVPADALPADTEQAALAIQVAPVAAVSTEGLKVAGPSAAVILTKLPDGEMVTPLKGLSFGLPYAADTSYDTKKLVLSVLGTDTKVTIPVGSKSDETKKQVLADSVTFNVITAVLQVDYAGGDAPANSFVYKITNADGSKSCSGWNEAAAASFTGDKKFYYGGTTWAYLINLLGQGSVNIVAGAPGALDVPSTGTSVDLGTATLTITCVALDGTSLGGDQATPGTESLMLSNWTEGSAGTADMCNGSACTPHTGSVDAVGHFDFTTSNGDIVKAALNVTIADFVWYTVP